MNRRPVWFALLAAMGATAGLANLQTLHERPAIVQQSPRSTTGRKKVRVPGFGPGGRYQRRSSGLPISAAQQKRNSRKRRNQLRHKRHCRNR